MIQQIKYTHLNHYKVIRVTNNIFFVTFIEQLFDFNIIDFIFIYLYVYDDKIDTKKSFYKNHSSVILIPKVKSTLAR